MQLGNTIYFNQDLDKNTEEAWSKLSRKGQQKEQNCGKDDW